MACRRWMDLGNVYNNLMFCVRDDMGLRQGKDEEIEESIGLYNAEEIVNSKFIHEIRRSKTDKKGTLYLFSLYSVII